MTFLPGVVAILETVFWPLLMQLIAYQAINCTRCALHGTLVGARGIHNRNVSASV